MEDGRIDENMLALSIGLTTTGVYGLARAANSEQWYRNIILHDSLYSCEQLLEFVYPELAKQNSWKLPVWYYISKSNMKSELAEEKAPHSYTEIVTESTIKRNRSAIGERTAWEVWTQEKDNLMKAIRLLGCMPEEKIDVNQYRSILQAIFTENNNILSSYNAVVELVNPVADTVSRKTYTGADVDWYVKAEDIVLKNKGNQNAGSPQNPTPQGQPKK